MPRSFLFSAHHPPRCGLPVPWWLGLEELPRVPVGSELLLVSSSKCSAFLLERVQFGPLRIAALERLLAGRLHQPEPDQVLCAFGVHRAPRARRLARGEAYHVALGVARLSQPIDPAEAKSLINRFRPGNTRLPGPLPVEAHPELFRRGMVLL